MPRESESTALAIMPKTPLALQMQDLDATVKRSHKAADLASGLSWVGAAIAAVSLVAAILNPVIGIPCLVVGLGLTIGGDVKEKSAREALAKANQNRDKAQETYHKLLCDKAQACLAEAIRNGRAITGQELILTLPDESPKLLCIESIGTSTTKTATQLLMDTFFQARLYDATADADGHIVKGERFADLPPICLMASAVIGAEMQAKAPPSAPVAAPIFCAMPLTMTNEVALGAMTAPLPRLPEPPRSPNTAPMANPKL